MNPTTAEPEAPEAAPVRTLTALDRCDACGAQAYVSVQMLTGDLLFCAHHYAKHEEKLASVIIDKHDERFALMDENRSKE